ncbi:uncharacterized protein LOC129297910 [Prosopis cineraria]|uniref:uncharacterized protein LOC129297910 n=1 Tax=Prosopis cineraria TaxID=364024 RepID=UPI00240F5F49|nr:uncharacterized protein LOC129297910 [Prosopis cineraria]
MALANLSKSQFLVLSEANNDVLGSRIGEQILVGEEALPVHEVDVVLVVEDVGSLNIEIGSVGGGVVKEGSKMKDQGKYGADLPLPKRFLCEDQRGRQKNSCGNYLFRLALAFLVCKRSQMEEILISLK